jgi:hypothetical protein
MSVIFDLKTKIEKTITDKKLDAAAIKGKIALQTGFLLSLITATTPDDPAKVAKLKQAAADILQLKL